MGTIRGHQTQLRILEDGQVVDIVEITKFTAKMDNTFMRSRFVGKSKPVGDQSIDGWSGNCACEVANSKIEDFIDALVNNNLAGIGVKDYALVDTELYDDGTSATYLYDDVQWAWSKESGSYDVKVTKSLDWQASGRTKI